MRSIRLSYAGSKHRDDDAPMSQLANGPRLRSTWAGFLTCTGAALQRTLRCWAATFVIDTGAVAHLLVIRGNAGRDAEQEMRRALVKAIVVG
jgi:hypothetical protein